MKIALFVTLLTLSFSSFASTYLSCGVFKGDMKTNHQVGNLSLDLDVKNTFNQAHLPGGQVFNLMNKEGDVRVAFGDSAGQLKAVTLNESMVLKMSESDKIVLQKMEYIQYAQDNYLAVCLLTGETDDLPW